MTAFSRVTSMEMVKDVDEAQFEAEVVERSREVPVVVDFWAEWCGPCRQLGPALEQAVRKRSGEIELVKVDVDSNQMLATGFGVRGIPAVKAFKDGHVVDEFTGAIPPAQIDAWLDGIVPSPADRLAGTEDEDSLRRALELDERHGEAAAKLGRILLARGDHSEAVELLDPFRGDFLAEGLAARGRLAAADGNGDTAGGSGLAGAFAAWDAGDHATALEQLQDTVTAEADRLEAVPGQRGLKAVQALGGEVHAQLLTT
ncbi:MAG: thioredoxin domain-containing protein, partial [Solirubrobacterales bacterium]